MLKFLDLPAHPFFVHGPVVLLPLVTLAALVLAFRPDWRAKVWLYFSGAVIALFVSIMLAMQSGQALDKAFKGLAPTKRHSELAETTRLLTVGLLVLTLAQAVVIRRRFRSSSTPSPSLALLERIGAYAVLLLGVIATIWMIRTGHEGAKAVWSETKL
jgi:hypothetical protein